MGEKTMRIVALQKRQEHDTSFRGAALCSTLLLATLTALPSQSAVAQGAVPCTAIDDAAERLACYDRALRGAPPPAATPSPAAQAPSGSAPPAAPAPTAAPSAAVTDPQPERRVRESSAPPAPAAPAATAAGSSSDSQRIIPIVIVSTRALAGRETTFTAEDGTSWVQTDSQRIAQLPDTPFDAQIKPGAMGSYFLVAKDRGRAIRVRQVR
jgi:hypothetical protein